MLLQEMLTQEVYVCVLKLPQDILQSSVGAIQNKVVTNEPVTILMAAAIIVRS